MDRLDLIEDWSITDGLDDLAGLSFSNQPLVPLSPVSEHRLEHGHISLNLETLEVTRGRERIDERFSGNQKKLTELEFRILAVLMLEPNHVHLKEELFQAARELVIRGKKFNGDVGTVADAANNLKGHIKSLREKLGGPFDPIETIRGIGYRLKPVQSLKPIHHGNIILDLAGRKASKDGLIVPLGLTELGTFATLMHRRGSTFGNRELYTATQEFIGRDIGAAKTQTQIDNAVRARVSGTNKKLGISLIVNKIEQGYMIPLPPRDTKTGNTSTGLHR